MDSNFPPKHKDTLVSSNSFDTSSSSKMLYKSKTNVRSKISLRLDMMEDDYLENCRDLMPIQEQEDLKDIKDYNIIKQEFSPISIKINLLLDIDNKETLAWVNLRVPENTHIAELIQNAVDKFNEELSQGQPGVQLKRNFENYDLKPSKKNGHPKTDLPAISGQALVKDINITQFSLLCQLEDIVIIKPKPKSCCECTIM